MLRGQPLVCPLFAPGNHTQIPAAPTPLLSRSGPAPRENLPCLFPFRMPDQDRPEMNAGALRFPSDSGPALAPLRVRTSPAFSPPPSAPICANPVLQSLPGCPGVSGQLFLPACLTDREGPATRARSLAGSNRHPLRLGRNSLGQHDLPPAMALVHAEFHGRQAGRMRLRLAQVQKIRPQLRHRQHPAVDQQPHFNHGGVAGMTV